MFLEIKGIKKSFGAGESHVDVLKGIDLEIEKALTEQMQEALPFRENSWRI